MNNTQAEHDARHPGKVCRDCPIEVEHRQRLRSASVKLRTPWYKRWLLR